MESYYIVTMQRFMVNHHLRVQSEDKLLHNSPMATML